MFAYYHAFVSFSRSANINASLPYAVDLPGQVASKSRSTPPLRPPGFYFSALHEPRGGPPMAPRALSNGGGELCSVCILQVLASTVVHPTPTKLLINSGTDSSAFEPEVGFCNDPATRCTMATLQYGSTPPIPDTITSHVPSLERKRPSSSSKATWAPMSDHGFDLARQRFLVQRRPPVSSA